MDLYTIGPGLPSDISSPSLGVAGIKVIIDHRLHECSWKDILPYTFS
jgi:hypothetical protein